MLLDQTTRMLAYLEALITSSSYVIPTCRANAGPRARLLRFCGLGAGQGQRREQNPRSRIQESRMFRVQTSDY